MTGLRAWVWRVIVAGALAIAVPPAAAQSPPARSSTADITPAAERSKADRVAAGNPVIGVLIIGGAVAFLVFVAWLFSRAGDGGSRPSDGTLN